MKRSEKPHSGFLDLEEIAAKIDEKDFRPRSRRANLPSWDSGFLTDEIIDRYIDEAKGERS